MTTVGLLKAFSHVSWRHHTTWGWSERPMPAPSTCSQRIIYPLQRSVNVWALSWN